MSDRKDDFLNLVISESTIDILGYLNKRGTGQYKDFVQHVDVTTLNDRVEQLLEFNLITHCAEKEDVEKEWYEITEKGRKVLQIIEDIIKLVEE